MILYRPVDGDAQTTPITWRAKTCFVMTQLGGEIPPVLNEIRDNLSILLKDYELTIIDADSLTTGKDFLLKIWQLTVSAPIGIAIIHEEISPQTMSNIFYELGWMQALGKETLVIKAGDIRIPSDFIRTEYVPYDEKFEQRIRAYVDSLHASADYYITIAHQLERNPLLAIDYLRRAYLLTGDKDLQLQAKEILSDAGLIERAKNSVEMLLASFIYDNYQELQPMVASSNSA